MNRQMIEERDVIVSLNSTACRLLGVYNGQENLVDEVIDGLEAAIKGLENFGAIAGCDSTPYTTIALRQIVIWLLRRDYDAAKKAFDDRYNTSDEKFCASMKHAWEVDVRPTMNLRPCGVP